MLQLHHILLPPLTPPRNPKPLFFNPKPSPPTRGLLQCSRPANASASPDGSFEAELDRLLALLPEEMRRKATEHPELRDLVEVVMDLGRKPIARFPTGDFLLSDSPISFEDLHHAASQVGDFAVDNRAGISRTLHRISAIRNRKDEIIGLTCRVGRAVPGSASLLTDLVQDGASLLLIGPPGVGKTTIIREVARMLANDYKKRVMIVDTSNEIGGDGDIPHAGIGNARRMQVPNSDTQHEVLIEAVQNHMPQVIVIDEIGTKLEAMAASTIAQRGIQLVATAHGITIQNLIRNPSLDMLIGGIQNVTLGDEEASRRGVQKTVLERKGRSTFSCGVEIVLKTELRVHRSLEATVDAILSGRPANVEVRKMGSYEEKEIITSEALIDVSTDAEVDMSEEDHQMLDARFFSLDRENSISLFVYGIAETSVIQGINKLELDSAIHLTDNISEADALLASQPKLKKNSRIQAAARSLDIPIYATKTSSLVQITKALRSLMSEYSSVPRDTSETGNENLSEKMDALEEARIAIEKVVIPKGESVELLPRPSHIITFQMELIQKYQLETERLGVDPDVRIRIHPFQSKVSRTNFQDSEDANGSPYTVDRLPLLPEES